MQIKDEYKARNAELVDKNFRLSDENKRLFSEAILDRDRQITELQQRYVEAIQQYNATKEKLEYVLHSPDLQFWSLNISFNLSRRFL